MSPLRPIARRALAAQSDERLVRLLREGHEPAFEEIVRRYRSSLVAFATAIVSHSRAEDVVQTALAKAHRALLADSREINLKPWLFTIVRNGALNTIRAEPLADELLDSSSTVPGPAETAERNEELERLVEAICALPAAQRQALVKRELEGEGHGEIAAQLGTTSTAVRGLIFRARTSLRDAVGAILPVPVLRMLLSDGPATAGAAGGAAASTGVSAAVLGGAGAKGGTLIAAAIVALGTGIAVERGHRGDEGPVGGRGAAVVRSADANQAAAPSPLADADADGAGDLNGTEATSSGDEPLTIGDGASGRGGTEERSSEGSSGPGGASDPSGAGAEPGDTPGSNGIAGGVGSGQGGPGVDGGSAGGGPGGGSGSGGASSPGGPGGGSGGPNGGGGSGEPGGGSGGPSGGSGGGPSGGSGGPNDGSGGGGTSGDPGGSGPSGGTGGTTSGSGAGAVSSGDGPGAGSGRSGSTDGEPVAQTQPATVAPGTGAG